MPVELQPVHNVGQRGLVLIELEFIGQQPTLFPCPHCREEREHFIATKEGEERRYAICRACGQGSLLREVAASEVAAVEATDGRP